MTDGLDRRITRIEENCPAQVQICQTSFKLIADQLTESAVQFGRHDTRIQHLEDCATSVKKDVNEIKIGWNRILAGIAVACVLLAINAIVTFVTNGSNAM